MIMFWELRARAGSGGAEPVAEDLAHRVAREIGPCGPLLGPLVRREPRGDVVVERDGRAMEEVAAIASTTLGCVNHHGSVRELPEFLQPE